MIYDFFTFKFQANGLNVGFKLEEMSLQKANALKLEDDANKGIFDMQKVNWIYLQTHKTVNWIKRTPGTYI